MKILNILFGIVLFYTQLTAQQNEPQKDIEKKKFPVFYEKVYIHTDREYYSTDETIWFKAYLVNALSNIPMETSGGVYVELISNQGKLIQQNFIRLDKGLGNGDFELNDSLPGGTYKLRAYSNWMLNFGNLFIFEKNIQIHNIKGIKPKNIQKSIAKPTIQFFPESGSLLTDIINTVSFKALDENNKSCNAEGVIVSSNNDTLTWFNTSFNGMGALAFMPSENVKYFAVGKLKSKYPFKVELPASLSKGYVIHLSDLDTSSFYVSILTNEKTYNNTPVSLIINGVSHGRNCITANIPINSLNTDFKLSKRNFPAGIASFTLYDSLLRPYCTRLFNISKLNPVNVTVNIEKAEVKPREKTTITLKVTDKNGNPVSSNLSITVIDKNMVNVPAHSILSYLNLESEVRGNIENPWVYFDENNKNRNRQLDLLLLTQGWRDFVWKRLKDTSIVISHMVETGISISGKLRQKFADNPIPDANITAYVPKSRKNSILTTKTNANGIYYIDGLVFFGKQKVIVTSTNEKGKYTGWIFLNPLDSVLYPISNFVSVPDSNNFDNNFVKESEYRSNILKKYSLQDTIHLEEVKVIAKSAREEKQNREHLFQGGFADYDFKITEDDYNYSLGMFLSTKVPRVEISTEPTDEGPVPNDRVLFRSGGNKIPPRFVLDGFSMQAGDLIDESLIYNIPMENIERIMVSTNDVLSPAQEGMVISIYTNGNTQSKTKFYTISKQLNGYYDAQKFYSPVYLTPNKINEKPDLRTTIFWEPYLQTNEKGECTVTFYNSDKASTAQFIFEGITDNGVPIVKTGTYEIK